MDGMLRLSNERKDKRRTIIGMCFLLLSKSFFFFFLSCPPAGGKLVMVISFFPFYKTSVPSIDKLGSLLFPKLLLS